MTPEANKPANHISLDTPLASIAEDMPGLTLGDLLGGLPTLALRSLLRRSPAQAPRKIESAAMLLRGERLKDMSGRLGKNVQHFSEVINARRASKKLERVIAEDLGAAIEDIWTPQGVLGLRSSSQGSRGQSSKSGRE